MRLLVAALGFGAISCCAFGQTYSINTFAGGGTECSGADGPATSAGLCIPGGVAADSAGAVYIADTWGDRIRKVSNGAITTVAGNGTSGFSGDNGPASSAQLYHPGAVAFDAAGNMYIADSGNNRIREVSNGAITTVAGGGTAGYGDGVAATAAQLNNPAGVAFEAGALYIVDYGTNRIREVYNGAITTVAGGGTAGLWDGIPATSAELSDPSGVAFDAAGNMYIADSGSGRIRKVSNGAITTVAGSMNSAGFGGDGGPAVSAQLLTPKGVAFDAAGNMYIADSGNNRVRKVTSGVITTIAGNGTAGSSGDGGLATGGTLNQPSGIALDSAGNVYVASGSIRVLTPSANSCLASAAPLFWSTSYLGGTGTIAIQIGSSCAWTVQNAPAWITVSRTSGTGPGSVTLTAGANSGAELSGTVSIAGVSVAIEQSAWLGIKSFLSITSTPGDFALGQFGGTYTLTISNPAGASPTSGLVDVSASLPYGMTLVSMTGTGWTCPGSYCVRSDALAGGASYPPITVTLNLSYAAAYVKPTVIFDVSGGGAVDTNQFIDYPTIVEPVNIMAAANATAAPGGTFSIPVTLTLGSGVGVGSLSFGIQVNDGPPLTSGLTFTPDASIAGAPVISTGGTANAIDVAWASLSPALGGTRTLGAISGTIPGGAATGQVYGVSITAASAGEGTASVPISVGAGSSPALLTVSGPIPASSMAQIASGGLWNTTITLVNTGTEPAEIFLTFYGDGGGELWLPVVFPQSSSTTPQSIGYLDQMIAAGAELVIQTAGTASQTTVEGWAQLLTSGNIGGSAVYAWAAANGTQEAVAPIETRNPSAFILPFDYTGGYATGVAVASVSNYGATIPVVLRDDTGTSLGAADPIMLPGYSHTSFMLASDYPAVAGKRGTIELDVPSGGQISALGIRAAPDGAITTVPVLASGAASDGSMAQLAAGGLWNTTITLANTSTAAAQVSLNFYGDDGGALALPLLFPQTGSTQTASSLNQSIAPEAQLVIETAGTATQANQEGWAQLTATGGNVGGSAVFGWTTATGTQEAVAPIETRNPSAFVLPFDYTGGYSTGVALANLSNGPVSIPVVLRDDTGASLGTAAPISLAAYAHTSFMLASSYPAVAGKLGTLELDTPTEAQISALGIRAAPGGAITSVPVIAK